MDRLRDLAELCLESCPPERQRVSLKAELDRGWSQMDLRYTTSDGREHAAELRGILQADIHEALQDIWQEMARMSGQRWSTCRLDIAPGGEFKLSVDY
jgi:hypothetical protein